jgi:uncharacterized protein YndB with AHSA1/START domain
MINQAPRRIRRLVLATPQAVLPALLGLSAAFPVALAPLNAQEVSARVEVTDTGERLLIHELVLPAPRAEVWAAFTTAEGFMGWAAPFAVVDLRVGGQIESSYDPAAQAGDAGNIVNRILAFVPGRMLALQAEAAPPGFPHPEILPDLSSVAHFSDEEGGGTRVIMYGVGYEDTPEHLAVLELFREANAWTLRALFALLTDGPVDWAAVLGGG